MKEQKFLDVITTFFGCNRTSCKSYYNLRFKKVKSEEAIFFKQQFLDEIALAVNVRDFRKDEWH